MNRKDMTTLHPSYNYDLQLHAKKSEMVEAKGEENNKDFKAYAMDGVNYFGAGYNKDDLKFY